MVARLAAIADAGDKVTIEQSGTMVYGTNQPHLIPVLRQRIAQVSNPVDRYALRTQLAMQLLQAGQSKEALEEFDVAADRARQLPESMVPAAQKAQEAVALHGAIGISALRLGEQENCILNHRASSCLFPINAEGVHRLQSGARRAIDAFTRRLTAQPGVLGAAWLLNLAYMQVGEYPEKVPPQWRISPDVFKSEYDIKRFPDVAISTGVDTVGLAGGSIIEDFDGDGYLDIVASSWGLRDQLRFFKNDGSGRFVDRTREAGLLGQTGGINLTHADYDNDGHPDVLVIRGGWLREAGLHPESLLRNKGNGTFEDVTEAAGLLSFHPTHTAAWADYDNDGLLDLFAGHEDWGTRHPSGAAVSQQRQRHLHGSGSGARLRRPRRRQGRRVGRLQQRPPARSVRVALRGAQPAVPQRRHSVHRRDRRQPASRDPDTASPPGSSTTTTTAGSTSSWGASTSPRSMPSRPCTLAPSGRRERPASTGTRATARSRT